ncbi:MAG: hypothetical protein KVP17_003855 [Porospora cf. gigantea B]|uniref:uncharacterized protein n=1 Tax=Porospora cf. gigantea B TaxID=2853592 RepID=UPI003571C091|nr:MAG: hypothetical protein KVP17_003855 [Porospora cf. gigantea B]
MSCLEEHDPTVFDLICKEKERQMNGIELIASENFTSLPVLECLGSVLTNKYSEGQIGARYYGGTQFIDELEALCKRRALAAFGLDPEEWGVNVQPYSGSPANLAVYTALLNPHDRLMGLDLPSGGHLTHGFYTAKKKISATSIFFESLPYQVDPATGRVDFDKLRQSALLYRPKMIVCGASAYARHVEFKDFRKVADEVNAYLFADIAHISGLVASGLHPSPFEYCDVVSTTTHKTLRGPRSGMIFYNKKRHPSMGEKIDFAVFPSLQGGPHNHQIAALATQLKEVASPEFKMYSRQVICNCQTLADALMARGYKLVTDGTDNHLLLWDLSSQGITGSKMEAVCDSAHISLNKNTVPGDKSAFSPSGVRIGTPAMTTRGCGEAEMLVIADFLHRCVDIALRVQQSHGAKLVNFKKGLLESEVLDELRREVVAWAKRLPFPC